MSQTHLDRRRVLSGGLALASTCLVAGRAGAVSPMEEAAAGLPMAECVEISEGEVFGMSAAEAAACHAPFRAAFLDWLGEASGRLALPVSIDTTVPSSTGLRIPGLHPALDITLSKDMDINVYVEWRDICWDILVSLDVYAIPGPDGSGWRNTLSIPEEQQIHPTRESCWRQDGFEWLLRWLNDDLATATHLALCGGDDCYGEGDWTFAQLVRDGLLVSSGKPLGDSRWIRELLPLYA